MRKIQCDHPGCPNDANAISARKQPARNKAVLRGIPEFRFLCHSHFNDYNMRRVPIGRCYAASDTGFDDFRGNRTKVVMRHLSTALVRKLDDLSGSMRLIIELRLKGRSFRFIGTQTGGDFQQVRFDELMALRKILGLYTSFGRNVKAKRKPKPRKPKPKPKRKMTLTQKVAYWMARAKIAERELEARYYYWIED